MLFVAISDIQLKEGKLFKDKEGNTCLLRVPTPVEPGDVVAICVNSGSLDARGNPRKELRIYKLPQNNEKRPPDYRLNTTTPPGGRTVFEFYQWDLLLYTLRPYLEGPFHKLITLLTDDPIDVEEVFKEFDRVIFKLAKKGKIKTTTEVENLYEKASKCKARLFSTPFEGEAKNSFWKAVELLGKIIKFDVMQYYNESKNII
jgi:hypothetical protein